MIMTQTAARSCALMRTRQDLDWAHGEPPHHVFLFIVKMYISILLVLTSERRLARSVAFGVFQIVAVSSVRRQVVMEHWALLQGTHGSQEGALNFLSESLGQQKESRGRCQVGQQQQVTPVQLCRKCIESYTAVGMRDSRVRSASLPVCHEIKQSFQPCEISVSSHDHE